MLFQFNIYSHLICLEMLKIDPCIETGVSAEDWVLKKNRR